MLISLLAKCRRPRNTAFVNGCVSAGVHRYVLDVVASVPATSESVMFALCGDILVALLKKSNMMTALDTAPPTDGSDLVTVTSLGAAKMELREFVDGVVALLQNQLRKLKQMKAAVGGGVPAPAEKTGLRYEDQAYKFVMLLGFVGEDNLLGQGLVGDRGGIAVALEYLNYFRADKTYVKWCSWALIVSAA